VGADVCVVQGRLLTVKLDRALREKRWRGQWMALPDFKLILLFRQSSAVVYKQLVNMDKGRRRPPKES